MRSVSTSESSYSVISNRVKYTALMRNWSLRNRSPSFVLLWRCNPIAKSPSIALTSAKIMYTRQVLVNSIATFATHTRVSLPTHSYSSPRSERPNAQVELPEQLSHLNFSNKNTQYTQYHNNSCNSNYNRETIDPHLISELTRLLEEIPRGRWEPISSLYAQLTPEYRRKYVKPHKTLLNVLQLAGKQLDITINSAGVMYCKGEPPSKSVNSTSFVGYVNNHGSVDIVEACECPEKVLDSDSNQPSECTSDVNSNNNNNNNNNNSSSSNDGEKKESQLLSSTSLSPFSSSTNTNILLSNELHKNVMVDFFYNVELDEFPPPPADFMSTPSARKRAKATEDGSVMALSTLIHFIPPFFVPMQEVLKNMPGYTEQHIENYFSSDAIEIVKIDEERFIRFHGGYIKVKLDDCRDAEELFAQYKPNVALAEHFVEAFNGVYDKWIALPLLLSRTRSEVIAQLPYQSTQAIMYFAQMQHLFAFSVDNAGKAAVLLRKERNTQLTCDDTPTPKLCNFILRFVPGNTSMDVSAVEIALDEDHRSELTLYYGTLINFFKAHGEVFYLSEDNTVVMRARYHDRMQEASLSLEEQVELALKRRDKNKVRTLRRRIAFRDNPSHPFHDPDNLAREVSRYLPQRGFVTMRQFLTRVIPEEVTFFMPRKVNSFFSNYPQYFVTFEYQRPANWCICSPVQPLPRGVIKQEFTDDDIVRLIATMLQSRRNSASCSYLFINLPHGAQEIIRRMYGGMYNFIEKYPQYFNMVLKSDVENEKSSAVVHLIQLPSTTDGTTLTNSSTCSSSSSSSSSSSNVNYEDDNNINKNSYNSYEDEYGDGV